MRKLRHVCSSVIWMNIAIALAACDGTPATDRDDNSRASASSDPTLQGNITDGERDSGHSSVGIVVDGRSLCSGTMIGKRTVLTSATCIKENPRFRIHGRSWRVSSVIKHPKAQHGRGHDLALLRLSNAIEDVVPARIATSKPAVGDKVTLVGFGRTGRYSGGAGIKRTAHNTIRYLTSTMIAYTSFGTDEGNICNGDTGGPSFSERDGNEVIVGVHALHNYACGQIGIDVRVDANVQWIRSAAGSNLHSGVRQPIEKKAPRPQDAAASLPLLARGSHLGMIVGFEALPEPTAKAAAAGWNEARKHGMSIGRIHHDWVDFEPTKGNYRKAEFETELAELKAKGVGIFVGIYVTDTEEAGTERLLPADLAGKPLDDPEVLRRYAAFLDWAVPMIVGAGGFVLAVGNEPDPHLLDHPEDTPALATFIRAARKHVQTIDPRLAVTITLTTEALHASHGPPLIAECDVATFNYYPIDFFGANGLTITDTSLKGVRETITAMLAAAKGRQLLIQELGCPAGPGKGSLIGTSRNHQIRFLENTVALMRNEPRFRAALWFQQVDWSTTLTKSFYSTPFAREGLPKRWIRTFEEYLETSGFLRYKDGSKRSASWSAFLAAQDALSRDRDAR